jgi:hypothetical protein
MEGNGNNLNVLDTDYESSDEDSLFREDQSFTTGNETNEETDNETDNASVSRPQYDVLTMQEDDGWAIVGNGLMLHCLNMNAAELKKILITLNSTRERRPRKCRKFDHSTHHGKIDFILSRLPPPEPIRSLYLSWNKGIGNAGMYYLNLLPDSVSRLDIEGCGITSEGMRHIRTFLETNETITDINITYNNICDNGALHIARMLAVNTSLKRLHLGNRIRKGPFITPTGFECIANALTENETLTHIMLQFGDFLVNDNTTRVLCQSLKVNRGLQCVYLSGSAISDFSPAAHILFRDCLLGNTSLRELSPFRTVSRHESAMDNQSEISYLLTLNNLNRNIIRDEHATMSDWLDCIIATRRYRRVDFSYFFLRSKPELCMHSR